MAKGRRRRCISFPFHPLVELGEFFAPCEGKNYLQFDVYLIDKENHKYFVSYISGSISICCSIMANELHLYLRLIDY
jgi:hypothetical protein